MNDKRKQDSIALGQRIVAAIKTKLPFLDDEITGRLIVSSVTDAVRWADANPPPPDPFEKFAEFLLEGGELTSSPEAIARLEETVQKQLARANAAQVKEPSVQRTEPDNYRACHHSVSPADHCDLCFQEQMREKNPEPETLNEYLERHVPEHYNGAEHIAFKHGGRTGAQWAKETK